MTPPPPSPWSRRTFLAATGGTALAAGLAETGTASAAPVAQAPAATEADDAFAALRAKWRTLILGEGFSPTAEPFRSKLATLGTQATGLRATMAPAAGSLWPGLGYADPSPDTDQESYGYSARMNDSFTRLSTMAQAYAQPGTGVTGDPALRDAVITGLDHLCSDVYSADAAPFGNWWNFQIGSPQALLDTAVLLRDQLSAEQLATYCRSVDRFLPDSAVAKYTGTSTGANRVDLCRGIILRGVVGDSAAKITLGRDALSPVFPYVTSGDGFYADGSFVQHTDVPYIGGYGAVLHDGLGRLFALLRDSTWQVDDPGSQLFLDTVEKAIAPFIYNGLMMDNVSSRGISRGLTEADAFQLPQDDHTRAHSVMASVVLVGRGASAEERARWNSMVKGWLQRDSYGPALRNPKLSLVNTALLQKLADDDTVKASPEPAEHRTFHNMDRATHRRRDWGASVSMASARIAHYEFGNGEHARGYHTGSGWLSWWGGDHGLAQYSDTFWPTVDPYRLPGVTVSKKLLPDGFGGDWGNPKPDTTWVGGTTDGEFGTTGQHLRGIDSTMTARKSWFWLDDSIVCLGAGITSADGAAVETVIDNRNLGASGTAALTLNGIPQPAAQGWSTTRTHTRWAHIQGHAGYVFPQAGGSRISALREERTGAWKDINAGSSPAPFTRRYLTLWQDHGTDPRDASYAYILMPGAGELRTAARALDPLWLRILANTSRQHGIRVPSLGFTGINFWASGTVGTVTADAPVSVQIRERRDGTATVSVADPSRSVKSLTLTWKRPVASVLSKAPAVTGARTGSALTLTFGDLSGSYGATHRVRVRTA
ncbi:polysaccharide lyase 8 family protein [Streptomyces laculatispora]|uniref:Polysaccharide lyase 8 family protein n=1 Tax=Streptomyces laculatispora TaxID=887464 RepID=A0ABY9HX11_9ACTN|nr:polysaccharide lyase 8 family protein [Streptomyces laculatispora]WLQ38934.1 polysaccharide lyase 8 family protein [Streptomyces laculatispora]